MPTEGIDGWYRPRVAVDVGQLEDLVKPQADGTRLHWQRFSDGTEFMHRDKIDPDRGAVNTVLHVLTETPVGPLLGLGLAVLALTGSDGSPEDEDEDDWESVE